MPKRPGRPRGAETSLDARTLARLLARLGRNLKVIRSERDLTQESFAELISLDARYYQRIETGHINITLGTLVKIARRLKVDPGSLIAGPSPANQKAAKATRVPSS